MNIVVHNQYLLYFNFLQTIEKQTVERMKRRHKNIHNEILMEKRVSPCFAKLILLGDHIFIFELHLFVLCFFSGFEQA